MTRNTAKKSVVSEMINQGELFPATLLDLTEVLHENALIENDEFNKKHGIKRDMSVNDGLMLDKPEPELNGASIGNAHSENLIAQAPRVASKIRLVAIEKNEKYEEMTITTISFAPLYLSDELIPAKVQYRFYRVYNDSNETITSALHTATTKGYIIRSTFANEPEKSVYAGDIDKSMLGFARKSIMAGFARLDNAIAHVMGQAQRGEKLTGHDETKRATSVKFLTRFATKEIVKNAKTPISKEEIIAKAQAQAEQMLELARKETEK
jgi:hypothetical protein